MKKNLGIKLCALFIAIILMFTACGGDENYPVTVGQIKLKKAPEIVVALDPNAADVMLMLGYAGALTGRSDDCIQPVLQNIPSFGSAEAPDVDAIIDIGADAVFANETLGEVYLERLRNADINVFRLDTPKTDEEISVFYRAIGLIMGGRETGIKNATQEFDGLYTDISTAAAQISGSNVTYSICYLSLDSDGEFVIPERDTFAYKLLSATGSTVVTADNESSEDVLLTRNPSYIFYDSPAVLEKLGSNPETAKLFAVSHDNCFEISLARLNLIGISAALNAAELMEFMYPYVDSPIIVDPTDDDPDISDATDSTDSSDSTDSPDGTTDASANDLSEEYGITITEDLVIDASSDSALITILQQRLYDLGYITSEPDGKYGATTAQKIKDFQFLNNFIVSGIADYDTLIAMFSSDAVPMES